MPDWKEMYLHLTRETERVLRILTEAQQTCEALYLSADEPNLSLVPPPPEAGTAAVPPVSRKIRKPSSFSSKKPLTNQILTDIIDEPL